MELALRGRTTPERRRLRHTLSTIATSNSERRSRVDIQVLDSLAALIVVPLSFLVCNIAHAVDYIWGALENH
jgi:hypothetical protein